jgi:hypothetical protein
MSVNQQLECSFSYKYSLIKKNFNKMKKLRSLSQKLVNLFLVLFMLIVSLIKLLDFIILVQTE